MNKFLAVIFGVFVGLPMIALATGSSNGGHHGGATGGTRPTVLVTNQNHNTVRNTNSVRNNNNVRNTNNVNVRNDVNNSNRNTNHNVANGGNAVANGGAGGAGGAGGNASVGNLSNDQLQNQTQTQSQAQNQTSTSSSNQTQSADNNGNSQSVNTYNPRNAPGSYAPDVYPTAPCRIGGSFGGSVVGGALSIGGSKQDKECDKRELARSFSSIGQYEASQRVLCSTEAAKEVFGTIEECMKTVAPGPKTDSSSVTVTVNPDGVVTAEELAARDRKLIEVLNRK